MVAIATRTIKKYSRIDYISHLFYRDMEKNKSLFYEILQINSLGQVQRKYVNNRNMIDLVNLNSNIDSYVSINSLYRPNRRAEHIAQIRSLYIDIDSKDKGIPNSKVIAEISRLVVVKEIPKPTMIISTGGGYHLYWRVETAPQQAKYTFDKLEDYLYQKLKHIGADSKALDIVRLLRIPDTYNTKRKEYCRVVEINDNIYSMRDLREEYLFFDEKEYSKQKEKKKNRSTKKSNSKIVVNRFYNKYSLYVTRANDLKTLLKIRKGDMKGYRNTTLHMFIYFSLVSQKYNESTIYELAYKFNNGYIEPLRASEVKALVRSQIRAYNDYLNDNKRGYNYTNKSIISNLDISEEEQKHLKILISQEEKNRRRRVARRNEQGLTKREQSKETSKEKVRKLIESNSRLTQKEMAKDLNLSRSYVSKLIKEIKEENTCKR